MSAASDAPVSLTRRALPYAALLSLLVGAHGLLETARDGLFLVEQPITRLPWLYLAVTAGVLVLTPVQRRLWSGRLHVALPLTLAACAAVTLGFWVFAAVRSTVLGFYVWTALFSSLVFVQFWLTADEAFRVDEAKRAFGFIAAGGLLGAVSGTGAARIALDYTDPRTLLLISAGATVAAAGLALVAIKASCQGPEVQPEMTAARAIPGYVKRDPYLRLLAVLALLTAASATLIDYLFKAAVAGGIAPERIPRLVANVYLGQSALALVVELVLVGLLLRSSGVTRSLALLPLVVLAGTTGYAVGAGLVAMLILKTLDGGLRPSLYRVGTELLYLPIGPAERRVVKPSIDTLGQRGGQALASLLLLALPVVPERHQNRRGDGVPGSRQRGMGPGHAGPPPPLPRALPARARRGSRHGGEHRAAESRLGRGPRRGTGLVQRPRGPRCARRARRLGAPGPRAGAHPLPSGPARGALGAQPPLPVAAARRGRAPSFPAPQP